jgi:hypothetical protein
LQTIGKVLQISVMNTTTNRPRIELDANQVCDLCEKNEARVFAVAKYLGIKHHQFSTWYTESSAIARSLNATAANPSDTLRTILDQIA